VNSLPLARIRVLEGTDTEAVLGSLLGLSAHDIAELRAKGVV